MPDQPFSSIEEKVYRATRTPGPRPEFADTLWKQIASQPRQQTAIAGRPLPWLSRPAWAVAAFLILLGLVILAVGPQKVSAAFQALFSYVPGVGMVAQGSPIRVLAGPVSVTREGITLTVEQAYLTSEKTTLVYTIENVPASAYPHDENTGGCPGSPSLRLPDGSSLAIANGWGTGDQATMIYPPIPVKVQEASFVLPCIVGTLPGKAPENWELALHFVPAPPELTAVPVIAIPTPTPQVALTEPAAQPEPTPSSPYGIRIVLDQAVPLADGYYLIGHTEWQDERIATASIGSWDMKAFTQENQEIPLEPVNFREVGLDEPRPDQWFYKLYGKIFPGPLTLQAASSTVELKQPVAFELDPRAYGFDGSDAQLGSTWTIDPIELDVLGLQARVIQMKYVREGALKGFELGIEADPGLQNLWLGLNSAVTGGRGAFGGGSFPDESSGLIVSRMTADGQISLPLLLSARAVRLSGVWETTWTPPATDGNSTSATPTAFPQACITRETWEQAINNPPSIPDSLPQRALVSRGARAPDPSFFISSLDGSTDEALVFTNSGSLSPDGTRFVYGGEGDRIYVLDLQSKLSRPLTGGFYDNFPFWSPDGTRIAFRRRTDQGQNIYVMDADGQNVRALTESTENPILIGWAPNSHQVIFSVWKQGQSHIQILNVDRGEAEPLITTDRDILFGISISSDEQWMAYVDSVPGEMAGGIYVARLDGTEKRLLVQLHFLSVSQLLWSPDGKWLAFRVSDNSPTISKSTEGLINVENCQVVPLLNLNGGIRGWVK